MYSHHVEGLIARVHPAILRVLVRDLPETPRGTLTIEVTAPLADHTAVEAALERSTASFQPRGFTFVYSLVDPAGPIARP